MSIAGKTCTKCKRVLGTPEFYTRTSGKLSSHCKTCQKAAVRKNRVSKNPEKYAALEAKRKSAAALSENGRRTCTACLITKNSEDFHRSSRDGRYPTCRLCRSAQAQLRRIETADSVLYSRSLTIQAKRYGLTAQQVHDLKESGICDSCGKSVPKRLAIDHDHLTGQVRGVLCMRCNTGIGLLGDTLDGVERALSYLKSAYHV